MKIIIEGRQGTGKSIIAAIVRKALVDAGLGHRVFVSEDLPPVQPVPNSGVGIRIITRQT